MFAEPTSAEIQGYQKPFSTMIELLGLSKNILIAYALTTITNKYYVTFQDIREHEFKSITSNLEV